MAAITIDDKAKFVSVLTFGLGTGDASAILGKVQHLVEERTPKQKGFVGCVVMASAEKSRLLIVSVWESRHAWSQAQYDQEIGLVVSDVVETAESFDIQTYDTVTVVRA